MPVEPDPRGTFTVELVDRTFTVRAPTFREVRPIRRALQAVKEVQVEDTAAAMKALEDAQDRLAEALVPLLPDVPSIDDLDITELQLILLAELVQQGAILHYNEKKASGSPSPTGTSSFAEPAVAGSAETHQPSAPQSSSGVQPATVKGANPADHAALSALPNARGPRSNDGSGKQDANLGSSATCSPSPSSGRKETCPQPEG